MWWSADTEREDVGQVLILPLPLLWCGQITLRRENAHPQYSCGEDQMRESRNILHVNEPSLELLAVRAARKERVGVSFMRTGQAQMTEHQSPQSHALLWTAPLEPLSEYKEQLSNWLNFTNSDYLRVKLLDLIKASLTVILSKNYLTWINSWQGVAKYITVLPDILKLIDGNSS